jgi:hypothetical protein
MIALGDMKTVACWYTDLAGLRTSTTVTVTGQAQGGRYGCHRVSIAEQHWVDGGRLFCASREDASRVPIGQKIVVSGRKSPFGLDADPVDLSVYQARS